jgi:hypothetical protein
MKLSREKNSPAALGGARRTKNMAVSSVRFVPLGKIPAIRRTIHPFAVFSNGWAAAFSED